MATTIHETIAELRGTLQGYIEATYHIADPGVVDQRRRLLEEPGGVFQTPFLESTPRYETDRTYAAMSDIPPAAAEAFRRLAEPSGGRPLLFDPPYTHQAETIETILRDGRNAMIMTGTGSGKTESFLLPILGKLAIEARDRSEVFGAVSAVRAMVLYPMNALVNDQLARLRLLFGDPRVVSMFQDWSGRPARFARYTSRTPYAGVRSSKKDSARLRSFGDFFVEMERAAMRHERGEPIVPDEDARAAALMRTLRRRGKWPAKGSVGQWFGSGAWMPDGIRRRAVTLDDDAELVTRDEAQVAPPDLLITNYSMLEYMMMRPIERTVFDRTKAWLAGCPEERFLVVLDEAHLYRGAQGAEVGLLLRRLRDRLGIPEERFQVICATASFSDAGKASAGDFGSQLSGVAAASFDSITGRLSLRPDEAAGSARDVEVLAAIDLEAFFSEDADARRAAVDEFLGYRGVARSSNPDADLHRALGGFPPFAKLVNETMRRALSLDEARGIVFADVDAGPGDRALNALLAMGSRARLEPGDASLLPCRVHAFYRGLPGLWACLDPSCDQLSPAPADGTTPPIGSLYGQPRERCGCGAMVFQYHTCRYCGTSYARAYAPVVGGIDRLNPEPGRRLRTADGEVQEFQPVDLLLEAPLDPTRAMPAFLDLTSGIVNAAVPGERQRTVWLRPDASGLPAATDDEDGDEDAGADDAAPMQFVPCGCCGKSMRGGKSSVQDHVTKGDQPFQALVSTQIRVQPPSPVEATAFAPLRGRKVLAFSDSRQVAARLAPALQLFSLRDALRALLPVGYRMLEDDQAYSTALVLDSAWIAVVAAAHRLGVRLRPELEGAEVMPRLEDVPPGAVPGTGALLALGQSRAPTNLTRAIVAVLKDNILGLEPLAIASVVEAASETARLRSLPPLPGLAVTAEDKLGVARAWLRAWVRKSGAWFRDMPPSWWGTGGEVRSHRGDFQAMKHVLATPALRSSFKKEWLPRLLPMFTEAAPGGSRLVARKLSLLIGGEWVRCGTCTSVHRPIASVAVCIDCGSPLVEAFDPDTDAVFQARKGFYRQPIVDAMTSADPAIVSLIAAEHTAQLNAAKPDAAFSAAERHEMQFQDIDVTWRDAERNSDTSVDVLSSTTTMEVGIDIGDLSGVALRNMPPGRANYQQRAGRAGRRGNAVATVVAFGSSDSHDDHYFTNPQEMIRGQVVDPRLTLENPDIARRHMRAFLLQRYHGSRLPGLDPTDPTLANLFSVLGTVSGFRGDGPLNRRDLEEWLRDQEDDLRGAMNDWLPTQLGTDDRARLLAEFVTDLLRSIDEAIEGVAHVSRRDAPPSTAPAATDDGNAPSPPEEPAWRADDEIADDVADGRGFEIEEAPPTADEEVGSDAVATNLLDRLLYWGVLPRYAFPTDVAPFYVFAPNSTGYRAEMLFAPSQGLNVALSQYAPNKHVWIKGKQYVSKAVYSPFPTDRRDAWDGRRLYYECERCGHARTDVEYDAQRRGERLTCEACHSADSLGPARPWLRPPGFAHPWGVEPPSVPDEPAETAYATRAKLTMTGDSSGLGSAVTPNLRGFAARQHLLVSNSGPESKGYDYCVRCGRIESTSAPEIDLTQPHPLPYPNDDDPACPGRVSRGIVLGTDFPTDIALFTLRLDPPFRLPPADDQTAVAMRTVCEALAKAAARLLELESGEILAEHRPALNDAGAAGTSVEVFLYDTLAGGAGFSPLLVPRSRELFETALEVLEHCPGGCDTSCYRCLRSFRNRLDHPLLDRMVGKQLVRHVLTGQIVPFDRERASRSLTVFASDFARQFGSSFDMTLDCAAAEPLTLRRRSDGRVWSVDVQSPIAPGVAALSSVVPDLLVDDMRIRRHLGAAIDEAWSAMP